MNNPTLGVHLIVNNEAELLPRCLDSFAGADEIVVVDTGSTDDSAAIARTYGAQVLHCKWTGDFSEARNAGISHARTEWILVIDADEVLSTPLPKITEMLRDTAAAAFTTEIENWFGSLPEDRVTHRAVRLFRNNQGYRYKGRIHEGIDTSIISRHGHSAIQDSEVRIVHFGYLPELMAHKNKISRNEQLLRRALEEQPEDCFYSYNLAVTCCQAGRLDEAESLLSRTIACTPLQVSYRGAMIRDLCKIYLALGHMKEIDSLLAKELPRYSDYPDLHYIKGQSSESQGLPERAFQSYQQAFSLSESSNRNKNYVHEQGMSTFRPLHRMGVISQQLGHLEEAARYFHRSLQHHALFTPALKGIVSAFQHLGVPENELAALLTQLVPPVQPAARTAVISTLYAAGAYETLAGYSRQVFPLEKDTLPYLLSAYLITGRFHEAAAALKEGRLIFGTAAADHKYMQQLSMIEAIVQWEMEGQLQQERFVHLPRQFREEMYSIDRLLRQKKANPLEPVSAPAHSALTAELIVLSVKLHRYGLSSSLAELLPAHRGVWAAALYEEGRWAEAGELFIELAGEQLAQGKVLFYIAEMLYDKGHYSEASGWFRQKLEESPGHEASRIGLSLCYLQQAKLELEETVAGFKEGYSNSPLMEDITGINNAIAVLNRTPWHTQWSYHQREGGAAQ